MKTACLIPSFTGLTGISVFSQPYHCFKRDTNFKRRIFDNAMGYPGLSYKNNGLACHSLVQLNQTDLASKPLVSPSLSFF